MFVQTHLYSFFLFFFSKIKESASGVCQKQTEGLPKMSQLFRRLAVGKYLISCVGKYVVE